MSKVILNYEIIIDNGNDKPISIFTDKQPVMKNGECVFFPAKTTLVIGQSIEVKEIPNREYQIGDN